MKDKVIKGFKGFNQDWTCNNFQFKPGEEYEHKGEVQACESGFHFCENPLDVFGYYPPGTSCYAEVEGTGESSKEENGDSKVSVSHLKIGAEISLHSYISAAVKFVFEKATKTALTENKEEKKIASNSGDYGAASNRGTSGAASNSGTKGAASNSGDYGAASNSGYQGAASNSGYQGAASNSAKEGCAVAMGIDGKAQSSLGGWITICEWAYTDGEYHRINMKTAKVDGKKIKADTFYILKNGKFVEAK